MPRVRATLPERYATAVVLGLLGAGGLFIGATYMLVGIIYISAPLGAWVGVLAAEGISLIVGSCLATLYWHDRALMRDSQAYQDGGELA